jgi:hypothetical protein
MSFLAEMLAVAVVWLSSFALCQFGVAIEHAVCPHAKSSQARTVSRSRDAAVRPVPVTANAPLPVSRGG